MVEWLSLKKILQDVYLSSRAVFWGIHLETPKKFNE